jgi:broad specificity phosphatase PhoE
VTQLLLVRHGEPYAATGEPGSAQGADPGLAEAGRVQAERFAAWLSGAPERERVVEVVVSPMRRALESAAPAAAELGLEPVVAEGLAEYDRGHHVYRPVHELAASDDPDWARVRAGWFPTFVDVEAFRGRVLGAFDELAARHEGRDSVLVVCHAGTINVVLAELLGLARPLTFPLDHLGISRVLVSRTGERRVRSVNETQHVAEAV